MKATGFVPGTAPGPTRHARRAFCPAPSPDELDTLSGAREFLILSAGVFCRGALTRSLASTLIWSAAAETRSEATE